jgi:magnesium chelatase family protein
MAQDLSDRPAAHTSGGKRDEAAGENMNSATKILERVERARTIQRKRFEKLGRNIFFNSEMNAGDIERCITLTEEARFILETSARKFLLSGRAFHRVLKVARTIADLEIAHAEMKEPYSENINPEIITKEHILEALQYRKKV